MNFPYPCLLCPMKFQNEQDLQMHSQVHPRSSDENFEKCRNWISNADMLFPELDTMFFVNNMYHFDKSDVIEVYDNILYSADKDFFTKDSAVKKLIIAKDSKHATLSDAKFPNDTSSLDMLQCHVFNSRKSKSQFVNITRKENRSKHSTIRNQLLYNIRNKILMSLKRQDQKSAEGQESANPQCVSSSLLVPLLNADPTFLQAYAPNQELKNNLDPSFAAPDEPIRIKITRKPFHAIIPRIKPHSCDICGKNFTFVSNLLTHTKKHTENKVYDCRLCHRKFDFLYKLKRHMGVHMGGERHECEMCKKTYRTMSKFKRHRCIKKRKRPHSCPVCNRTFTRINYLNFHKRCHSNSTNFGDFKVLTE